MSPTMNVPESHHWQHRRELLKNSALGHEVWTY